MLKNNKNKLYSNFPELESVWLDFVLQDDSEPDFGGSDSDAPKVHSAKLLLRDIAL